MYRLLDQHKNCHVSNLKNTFVFKVLDEVFTENSYLIHFFLIFYQLNLPKYLGICVYCIYPPYSDFFFKPALEAEGSFFFTLKTRKLNGDLILCFELGISPVTQLALTYLGSYFCQNACILCHLLRLLLFVTCLHRSNQAIRNSEIKNGDWIQLTALHTC